jgi:hypothetical protein
MNSPRINETIKRFSILLILFCSVIIASVIVSGAARADGYLSPQEESFGDGVSGPLCDYLDTVGVNDESMTTSMKILYRHTPANMDMSDAVDIINYVVQNHCPHHWDSLVAFGEGFRSGSYA